MAEAASQMKGLMFTEKGRAEILDESMPRCSDDTILLQTLYSGLSNGTERMFLVGGNYGGSHWPNRIAYQHVSRVIECGPKITKFAVGDIVFTAMCSGHMQYQLARETDLIVKLPDDMDLIAAAMMGVASVSYHDCRLGRIAPEDNVLVFGAGLIGQFAAQSARLRGAHVTVVDRHEDRLALASELGADQVIDTAQESGQAALQRGVPYSVVMECCGGDVMDIIIGRPGENQGLIARRGRSRLVMVAGRYEVGYNFNAAGGAELEIIHTQHFDQADLEQVTRLLARGDIKTRPLISHITLFEDAVSIYDTLRDNKSALRGVVFDYGVI